MRTLPERLFARAAGIAIARPRLVLGLALLGALLALLLAAEKTSLRTSNLDLIDPRLPEVQKFLRLADEFGTPNMLVVVLEGDDPIRLATAVDSLAPKVAALPGVRGVLGGPVDDKDSRLSASPYLTSRDGRLYFLLVQPLDARSNAATIAPFVRGVRQILRRAELGEAGITAGLTGIPVYALDDQEVIQKDISKLSAVSLGLVGILFTLAFATPRRPLLAMAVLVVAVAWTLGVIALYPGHLTLLSAFFGSILVGLGADFGIHVIDRVEAEVALGASEEQAVAAALPACARGLSTGALSTALIFLSLRFCGFRGFEELGVIAGIGVLLCLSAMVLVLPALLVSSRPRRRPRKTPRPGSRIGRLLGKLQSPFVASVLALQAMAGLFVGIPVFDSDYLNLQPRASEAVALERKMTERSDFSPLFAAFVAESRAEAAELAARLRREETVASVRSIAELDLLTVSGIKVSEPLRAYFESPRGALAVYAYPKADVWNPEAQERFVSRMRAIDPDVTGMPFLGHFMVERSRRALGVSSLFAAAILLVVLSADFRDPRLALMAATPTLLTVASMHAFMRLLSLPYNPINVMALPVVVGIAVDDGVHIVHRFLAEKGDLGRTLAGTGRSVVLTSATTLAAFGALAFSSHRGLSSFALTLCLGVGAALAYSVLVLPQLLAWMRPSIREPAP